MKGLKKIILVYVSLISMFAISFKVESNKNDNIVDFPSNDIIEVPKVDSEEEIIVPPVIEEEVNKPIITKKTKVYINPSVQHANLYANGKGSEASNMLDVAKYLKKELDKIEFLEVLYNLDNLSLKNSVKESNEFDADIHLALHTNAGGGKGSEIYTVNSNSFSKMVYDDFNSLGNFNKRGVKNGSHLYEVKNSKADHVALMEFLFHDNVEEANWIVANKELIAKQLAKSIINFVSVYYYSSLIF